MSRTPETQTPKAGSAVIADTPVTNESHALQTTTQAMPAPNGKPFVSAGKRIHNEITYRGVDWLLNSTIGVAFTYWTARTKSGKEIFGKPVAGFFRTILKPILRSETALNEGAKWGAMFTSIIIGGTAIIAPMVQLEKKKNKKALMRWCDERVYGEKVVQNDPRFEQQYRAVDEEPKKNFTTGMIARLLVLAPMIAVTMIPATNKVMVKFLYNPIAKTSKWLCDTVGIRPKKLMERGVVELVDGDVAAAPRFHSDWDFIHRTIGFDLGLTFIYSYAHEAAIKALAAMGFKRTENGNGKTAAETETLTLASPASVGELAEEAFADPASAKTDWSEKHAKTKPEIIPYDSHQETVNKSAGDVTYALAP